MGVEDDVVLNDAFAETSRGYGDEGAAASISYAAMQIELGKGARAGQLVDAMLATRAPGQSEAA